MARHRTSPRRRPVRPLVGALGVLLAALLGWWALPRGDGAAPVLAAETAVPAPAPTSVPPAPPVLPAPPPAVAVAVPASACGEARPVVVASGPLAAVSVCDDDGALTYRATRTSDGASVVLPAERTGSSWESRSGEVTYALGDGELLITRAGEVLEQQVLEQWWQQPG